MNQIGADKESRNFSDRHEWALGKEVFHTIAVLCPNLDIDLFATRLNNQLDTYCCWKLDPGSRYVDTFSIDWSKFSFYAFPPFSLVPRCVQTISQDKAKGILVVPLWPTQPWFPLLLHDAVRQSTSSSTKLQIASTSPLGSSRPTTQKVALDGVSALRNSIGQFDLSAEATKRVMASWRTGTQKQYMTYIEQWLDFCGKRNINYCQPNVSDVIHFLMQLFNNGLSYSAINTARSALSTVVEMNNGCSIGSHPLVSRLIKGVYQSWPPTPKYSQIWDVSAVLRYLGTLHPVREISLKNLTLKFVMLLLLVSRKRGQDVHMLNIEGMKLNASSCEFKILHHTKTNKLGNETNRILIPQYQPDRKICPLETLVKYLDRTKVIRKYEQSLFISYIQPHHKVSRDTISRSVLESAGIDSFKND